MTNETRSTQKTQGLNGARVTRSPDKSTVFIPLPREQWRSCGKCCCPICKGREGFWDTIAVAARKPTTGNDHAWTVHKPQLHPGYVAELAREDLATNTSHDGTG